MSGYWQRTAKYLCRPFKAAAALHRGARQFGGVSHLLRRAINLSRREGWAGFSRGAAALRAAAHRQGGDGRNDYQKWVAMYDTLTPEQRVAMAARARVLAKQPVFSIIMPVYNPEPRWLQAALESVRSQIYTRWELCIADDASTDSAIRALLARYAGMDARIKVVYREQNGHISACSNSALALAQGDWVVLFDHDDLLAEHALFCVAEAFNQHPDAALIYSDEDKITETGVRCVPHFKPDWNYELFLSYNVICHLGAYRRELVQQVGGFREGYEGAQDYDLALRCVERLAAAQIVHVPHVLYHWRMHAGSTAIGGQTKPYALPAGERALNEHFARAGVRAHAELQAAGYYLPRFALPVPAPRVSLIVVVRDSSSMPSSLLALAQGTDYPDCEFILAIDGSSEGGSGDAQWPSRNSAVDALPECVVRRGGPGWCREQLIDHAVSVASGEFVALIEQDLLALGADWLQDLVALALQPGIGVVGPRIVDADGSVLCAGNILGMGGVVGWPHRGLKRGDSGYFHRAMLTQSLVAVPTECLVVRKSLYERAGGLAQQGRLERPMADVDFCLRLRDAGCRNLYAGHVALRKLGDVAVVDIGSSHQWNKQVARDWATVPAAVRQRWDGIDPSYNPNLSLQYGDFSLAWPPRVQAGSFPDIAFPTPDTGIADSISADNPSKVVRG